MFDFGLETELDLYSSVAKFEKFEILDMRLAKNRPKHQLILIIIYCHMKRHQSKIHCTPPLTHTRGEIRQRLDVIFEMFVIVSLLNHED